MTFGKPKRSDEKVRCLNCGESYRDCDTILKHAGRTVEGDFWNDKCPECGMFNMMGEEYYNMTEEEFKEEQHSVARYHRG